jgi:hypothetical protein
MSNIFSQILEILGPNGEHWCQDTYAMNKDGEFCSVHDPAATSFCLAGAISKTPPSRCEEVFTFFHNNNVSHTIVWNDQPDRTWEDVKDLLKKCEAQYGK